MTEHIIHVHDITVFTNLPICSFHKDDNGIVVKKKKILAL